MLFNIEHDGGDCIIGYIVPDGYSSEASFRVRAGGRILLEMPTTDVRPALVAAGRHETGRCGFILDSASLPNINLMADLEILESSTNFLIYRRSQSKFLKRKILRIDTHLFPFRKLDLSLKPLFQYCMLRIENFGRETIEQLFLLNGVDSIFLSGRIMYQNYQSYIQGKFSTFVMLQDPYEELAERLLTMKILSQVGQVEKRLLGEREEMLFAPVIAYMENLSLSDPTALKRGIMNMPRNVIALLSNPLVRQLTTSTFDEMPQRFSVASALDVLSSCDVIGFRHDPATINRLVAETLRLKPANIDAQEQAQSVRLLGAILKDTKAVDGFLEKDIELYQNALEAARVAGQRLGNSNDEG